MNRLRSKAAEVVRCYWRRRSAIAGSRASIILGAALALGGCGDLLGSGDLTRAEAERILNGDGRAIACITLLTWQGRGDGWQKARDSGAFDPRTNKVADTPDGDQWIARFIPDWEGVKRLNRRLCLPGTAKVLSVADGPFAPGNGSYKLVEFIETVSIPPELKRIEPFVFARYRREVVFQKTDRGWRVKERVGD